MNFVLLGYIIAWIATFSGGRTSWSIGNKPITVWEYWKLAEEIK